MHRDDVMGGEGGAKLGGRVVVIGTRALYASDWEATVSSEIRGRKNRLGGKALIDLDKYPRGTFRFDVNLDRTSRSPAHSRAKISSGGAANA